MRCYTQLMSCRHDLECNTCASAVAACNLWEASISAQLAACPMQIDDPNRVNTSYLNTACSTDTNGCAIRNVALLKRLQLCRSHGHTAPVGALSDTDLTGSVSLYEYACTLQSAGALPASNVYCIELTATWRGVDPTCAQVAAIGCCLDNLYSSTMGTHSSATQIKRAWAMQTCGVDFAVTQPCQPPGWANVTFTGMVVR